MSHEAATDEELKNLPDWKIKDGKLHREFKFADFQAAVGFIESVFDQAEKINHHPELFNVYNKVTIDLVTHETGGISKHDIELAQAIDMVFQAQA